MAKKKIPAEIPAPPLVPQPHGGALRRGGPNKGAGRPASEIRAKMRGALWKRLKIAQEIADDPKANSSDRLKALDFLAKYGMGTQQEVSGPDGAPVTNELHVTVTRRIIDGA